MIIATSTEDRIWAVLAHLSALAFGMGILLPVVGWSDQRRKSNYASFQCLQALGYQSVGFTVWVFSYLLVTILGAIILLATVGPAAQSNQAGSTVPTLGLIIFFILLLGGLTIYFVLPVIAAIACALGRDFRYPMMGDRLAIYLDAVPAQTSKELRWLHEEHEFRWVAAMGHFSILIALWGMLAPLTAWILQGKNSDFLKFQSIQALVYQVVATLLSFAGIFLYLSGILLFIVIMGAIGSLDLNSPAGMIRMVVPGIILLVSLVLILSLPLLHILGQWAGYRLLRGENYRYPLLGKLVEAWTVRPNVLSGDGSLPLEGSS